MAEIPIEKKSSFAWLAWLLLLAGILALLWFLFMSDDDGDVEEAVMEDDVPAAIADDGSSEIVGADDGTITDLAMLANMSDGSLDGRDVALTGVMAGEVVDDAGFWAMTGTGDRVWVVLDEVLTPDTPIEGRVDVDQGDTVDIEGVVRNASEGAPSSAAKPGPTESLPDGVEHFIYASKVTQSGS